MGSSFHKLSEALLFLGFFSALGTNEQIEGKPFVKKGIPMSFDSNNGIFVVYDEKGWPWIKQSKDVSEEHTHLLLSEFQMSRSAYVPHSNDGGEFKRIINSLL